MTQTISPLRQRMIEDMRLRNFTEGTQKTYVRAVANYSRYHGRSPDQLTYDDVRFSGVSAPPSPAGPLHPLSPA